ncbi:BON domain-containing protein [Actinoplanes awajinensis]|uniref:BON domain-containing protein n=1 Tax=Actinoplanes awajinensis subsp. mycoplanecinus TaxID=135947 RepID=A0A117MKX3_9ACTN|nr:BON domain-containing protein [Actinoplanes awajinensis]KUL22811.1 hypothetical protein ADL15_47335 [Actinoplanes awajinensis subsp. mycoplanecinus]
MYPFWNYHDEGYRRSGARRPAPDGEHETHCVGGNPDDVMLADRVADALRRDRQVRGRHVEILVQNRVVILLGEVDTVRASIAAGRCVWAVPGVFDVCNRLRIEKAAVRD